MCFTIDSENILLNYFSQKQSKEVTFRDLKVIRKKIEHDCDNIVYVDITYNSLRRAVSLHNNVFEMELTKILLKKPDSDELKERFISENINFRLPKNIKDKYLRLISNAELVNE